MASIRLSCEAMSHTMAYSQVRRAQAAIADFHHFGDGDLSRYLGRPAFEEMAGRLAQKFFHHSKELAMFNHVQELFMLFLVMAPIFQRSPYSTKLDWHTGHVLGWFRTYCAGPPHRVFAAIREVPRQFDPDKLTANLTALGVRDGEFIALLIDHYRRSYGESTVRGRLANALFDPIMLFGDRQGFELRVANRLYRVEKGPFTGSVDLRKTDLKVGDYLVKVASNDKGKSGSHLEIDMTDDVMKTFRTAVKNIVGGNANPSYKLHLIRREIIDFTERVRFARSAQPEMMELKHWLASKVRGLAGNIREFNGLPNELMYQWHQRLDSRLHLSHPNFFLDPKTVTEEVYMTFFSPYREET